MSLVPLLFRDWWDDFDRERPSKLLDQHFGLGLKKDDLFNNYSTLSTPLIRPGRYFRPWGELMRSHSGSSNIKANDKQFQVIYNYAIMSLRTLAVFSFTFELLIVGHKAKFTFMKYQSSTFFFSSSL